MIKTMIFAMGLLMTCPGVEAQVSNRETAGAATAVTADDSDTWKGTLYNKEYNVYFQIDFYHLNVTIPGQSIFGEMPGYFGDYKDGRKWLITNVVLDKHNIARLSITNDYGSEDLEATLERRDDGTYIFTQGAGSDMKIARNRKWQKLPKKMEFTKK